MKQAKAKVTRIPQGKVLQPTLLPFDGSGVVQFAEPTAKLLAAFCAEKGIPHSFGKKSKRKKK